MGRKGTYRNITALLALFDSMARYFFNHALGNGKMIIDPDGHMLDSMDAVKAAAIQAACDWARNKAPSEIVAHYVSVTDESDREVYRAPLR